MVKLCMVGMEAYGVNGVFLGRLESDGGIRKDGVLILMLKNGLVYSMHEQCLGRYKNGAGKFWSGSLIFSLREEGM